MLKKLEDRVWGLLSVVAYCVLTLLVLWLTYKVGLLTLLVGIFLFLMEGVFTGAGGNQLPGIVLFGVYSPFVILLSIALTMIFIPVIIGMRKGIGQEKRK